MKVLTFIGKVLACTFGLLLFPYLLFLLLLWSPIAWILNLLFPGREFYPVNKAWPVINRWVESKMGTDLNTILLFILVLLTLGAAVSWIAALLTGRK